MPIFASFRLPSILAALLLALLTMPARAADPMEAEEAFAMRARAIGPDAVEVVFDIAPKYYLYGERFRFEAEPPEIELGAPERPPGERKTDPFFGEVETYRSQLRMLLPVQAPPETKRFTLIVTSQGCWDGGVCYPPTTQRASIDLTASPGNAANGLAGRLLEIAPDSPPPAATPTPGNGDESGRIARLLSAASNPLALASFFGLGLLLAFTPCTFPMIPILSGIIVGTDRPVSRGRALALSLAYVSGMAFTYAAAGIAAGLTGTLLAAALQNAWALSAFALLFVLLALSMFGFFPLQLPSALQSRLADTANREKGGHLGGVAAMGVLSALIVGPCMTPPLAGALLYIAQTGDAALGGGALFVLALGMGAPLVAMALAARSALPKAGPWMEGVKKATGVLLLAVALWVATPVLPALAVMLGWAALLLFSGVFLSALDALPHAAQGWQRFWKAMGVMLLFGGVAMLAGALAGSRDPLQPLAVFHARALSTPPAFERIGSMDELDARLAAAGRPVMLDFYADWCVTCKEMERDTFSDPAVAARMGRMLLLQVDVTAYGEAHRALLQRFGLIGPPGIVFFDAAGQLRSDLRVVGFMAAEEFAALLDRAL
ncbi:MAG: protein-disulfide reductase DsbD [Azoarcus sp.]|jgi:thiol:disulfide interchange protein DsbD|nr:protein-disulfide reductase DsbD [Azoarcus sp.]